MSCTGLHLHAMSDKVFGTRQNSHELRRADRGREEDDTGHVIQDRQVIWILRGPRRRKPPKTSE